jgi:CDP-paratose 2-epimerase
MKVIIIGGAGFIGCNTASYFLQRGHKVVIYDNLFRKGSKKNLEWLRTIGKKITFVQGDVISSEHLSKLSAFFPNADAIIHLAAQVAVTSSVTDPKTDFEINALGTFNVLEAIRKSGSKAKIIYSSTNKVYGDMKTVKVVETNTRYTYKDLPNGISETQLLDFHSPYGCSKGTADQYMHDYARIYNLDTTVMRQSCIYGPHQFGVEDQGWVAWFIIAAVTGKLITVYGNGKQVRDLLYVDDLIRAYDLVIQKKKTTKGKIYNIGGGPDNSMSVWFEFRPILEKLLNRPLKAVFSDWRPGDQPVFISDIRKAKKDFAWAPTVSITEGITRLYEWVSSNKALFD